MTKLLPSKKTRNERKKATMTMSPALKKTMENSYVRVATVADKEARKDDKIQREARIAIAETLDEWLAWMAGEDPAQVNDLFFELGCLASATNRRRLFKHAQLPDGVTELVQEELDRAKAEEEKAKAEAEKKVLSDSNKGPAKQTETV
jgi:hypothetical protein